jgi:NADH pyrophosphatase NudC (nudix superfamily)
MDLLHWARLKAEGPYPLRRGAWYRVIQFETHEVVVDVNLRPVSVPRSLVEVVDQRPLQWTAVPRPRDAVRLRDDWDQYAVCPKCGNRASLVDAPQELQCAQCGGSYPVDWDEKYLGRP